MSTKKCLLTVLFTAAAALAIAGCSLSGAEPQKKSIVKPYISVQPLSASYYNAAYENAVSPALVYPGTPPTLSIEIEDWNTKDGKLSYQWYSFEDIEEYCESRGGTAISGATGVSYTPSIASTAAGKIYYFYVVVTNTNKDARDAKTATVQSEVAAIAFSDPGKPLVPVISKNPVSARYGWGATLNSLQVKAEAPDRDSQTSLTYQWYTNDTFSVKNGTPVPDANQSMMIPDSRTLDLGDNYMYVIVTNTRTPNEAQAITIPAVISIEAGKKAAEPRINRQPKDQFYFVGETVKALTVDAESLDNGKLSYQWYSNSAASSKGGTAVAGAAGDSFTPEVDTGAAGVKYYYVVVTNTNDKVKDKTPAAITSKAVKVQVGNVSTLTPNAFFKIPDPNSTHKEGPLGEEFDVKNKYQYIRGYGGMDVAWGNFPRTTQADTELMYDPERLGYNMLRIMIRADYVDPAQTVDYLIAGDRPDYFENVKIVNKYGGYVEASPWTPPKDWKSNNSINGGGNLIPGYYKLFANYLRSFAQYMYNNGAPIYAISISNEPNYVAGYDGCEWTPEEMRDFFLEVGHFTDGIRGWGGGKETPYVLTVNGESANTPNINLAALRNPQSKAAIDVLARHIYGERTVSLWNSNKALITKKDAAGNDVMMEVWMTEHNINSANATGYTNDSTWDYVWRFLNDVDLVVRMNNENAFIWWASKRFYSMVGDGQYSTTDGAPLPRGWALSHYARYTIDYTRIHLELDGTNSKTSDGTAIPHIERSNSIVNQSKDDMDNTSPRITAFISPDEETISLVLWTPTKIGQSGTGYNMGTIQVTFPPGFEVQGVSAHRSTSARDIFQPYDGVVLSEDRNSAFITLGLSQIISVKFTK